MSETTQLPGIGKIHSAIAAIMAEVGGVAKTRNNAQQNYKFRGIADIKLACQPLLAKHGVHLTPHAVLHEEVSERTTAKGGTMLHIRQRVEFRFYHSDGSFFPCVTTGEAMDSGDKASNKCMSAAMKYALDQVFCLPEDDPDADTEHSSPELGAKKGAPAQGAVGGSQVEVLNGFTPPADPLTNEEIITLSDLAKAAGFKARPDILPTLAEFGGGAKALKELDRSHLADVTAALQRLIAAKAPKPPTPEEIAKDVDEIFDGVAAV